MGRNSRCGNTPLPKNSNWVLDTHNIAKSRVDGMRMGDDSKKISGIVTQDSNPDIWTEMYDLSELDGQGFFEYSGKIWRRDCDNETDQIYFVEI